MTEALEAINQDLVEHTESKDWKTERWHSDSGNDGQISPNIEIEESDRAIISPTHNNCPEIVSGNNVNTSDIIDDDSNSTSGVDNGPKDMYEEEEDMEQNGHCDIVCAELTNDDDEEENDLKEEEALLVKNTRNSVLEKDYNEIKNGERLIDGDTLHVDEDNNTIISNNCGENNYPIVANGSSHSEKLSNELGNGNTLF